MDRRSLQHRICTLDPQRFVWAADEDDQTHRIFEGEVERVTIRTPPPWDDWPEPVAVTRHGLGPEDTLAAIAHACFEELGGDVRPVRLRDAATGEVWTLTDRDVADARLARVLRERVRLQVPELSAVRVHVAGDEASLSAVAPTAEVAERAGWAMDLACQAEDVDLGAIGVRTP